MDADAEVEALIRSTADPNTRRERKPTRFYVPNTKSEIAISSTLAEMIESSKFRSASAIRKKPLKFNHARQVFTDLGDPYKQNELKIKIGSCFKFECSKDPDVKQAADLLMELSSSASSSSSAPVWSDEMYPCFQPFEPEVVRLKLKGATPLELPLAPPPLVRQNAFCDGILA